MPKRVLICLSHSIEEFDQLRLLHGLGYEVASIGGYIDPAHPHDVKRPALDVPCYHEVKDAVDALGTEDNLGAAQSHIPDAILEWLGADGIIIFHHYLDRLFGQWDHLAKWRNKGGRCVWRTVGQSTEDNEKKAQPYRADGLEIVRYSPKERAIPGYAGEDVLIRFYKDEGEWTGWSGDQEIVINITQHLYQRDPWTNPGFWTKVTEGLPHVALGPGSEEYGGPGQITLATMQKSLRDARAYLYTGTQPASYTLGLLEALMTGIPTVSIGPSHMRIFPYGHELYEGHELCGSMWSDDPAEARVLLEGLLADHDLARQVSQHQQFRTRQKFGRTVVGEDWARFLG